MKDIFGEDKRQVNEEEASTMRGNYGTMIKERKKKLGEIEDTIRDALKNYEGQAICIVTITEDENGLPDGSHMVMAGVSRMECQVSMARALSEASEKAMDVLLKGAEGDVGALLAVATAVVKESQRSKK